MKIKRINPTLRRWKANTYSKHRHTCKQSLKTAEINMGQMTDQHETDSARSLLVPLVIAAVYGYTCGMPHTAREDSYRKINIKQAEIVSKQK